MDKMKKIADRLPPVKDRGLSIDAAVGVVAARHGVTPSEIMNRSRRPSISHPRQEAYWLARQSGASFRDIADYFGMDHTSIMHGCKQVDKRISEAQNG